MASVINLCHIDAQNFETKYIFSLMKLYLLSDRGNDNWLIRFDKPDISEDTTDVSCVSVSDDMKLHLCIIIIMHRCQFYACSICLSFSFFSCHHFHLLKLNQLLMFACFLFHMLFFLLNYWYYFKPPGNTIKRC